MENPSKRNSRTCTIECIGAAIGRAQPEGHISRRRTAPSGHSAFCAWCGWLSESAQRWRSEKSWHDACCGGSRSLPSNAWWLTKAGWHALSRPPAAEGGGRRPAFTGRATQPYSATEVEGCPLRGSILRPLYADSRRREQRTCSAD